MMFLVPVSLSLFFPTSFCCSFHASRERETMAGYRAASLAIPIPKSRSRSKKAKSLENTGSALYMDAMSPKSSLSTQSPFVPMSPKSPASSSCHDSSTSTAQQRWRHSRANSLSSNTRSLSSFRRSPSNSSLSSLPKQHELHERSKSLMVHSASEGASLMNLLDLKTNRSSRSPLSGRTLNSTPRTLAALAAAGAAGDVGMGRSFSSPASTSLADLNEFPSAASSCSVSLSVSSTKAAKPPAPIVVVTGDAEEDVEALPQTPYERKMTKDALFRGRLLLEKRCNVQECKPNGNCLFASVGFIVGETYDEVRQKCCDYIRRESTFFQDFCEEDVDDYVGDCFF